MLPEPSDEMLMARYAEGDHAAFEELFGRYQGRAYAFFLQRARSPDRAADLYQELFLRLHRFRHTFRPERGFAGWFFQIAQHVFIDDLRRNLHRSEEPQGDQLERAASSSAETRLLARSQLRALIGGLSAEQLQVLVAAKLLGIPHLELAGEIGKSVDAVKQTSSRTLRRLRREASTL
jgi:RNA polymerase sigma-70 factor (ECF subfamily)